MKKEILESKIIELLENFPDKIPVIFDGPGEERSCLIVPKHFTAIQCLYTIRNKLSIKTSDALFIYTPDNKLLPCHESIDELYIKYKSNKDQALYLYVERESTFG